MRPPGPRAQTVEDYEPETALQALTDALDYANRRAANTSHHLDRLHDALAERDTEVQALREACATYYGTITRVTERADTAAAALAERDQRIARALVLHHAYEQDQCCDPVSDSDECEYRTVCHEDGMDWPCDTAAALTPSGGGPGECVSPSPH